METNTRTIINYSTWDRQKNFDFFKNHLNPNWSVTCEVECTSAYNNAKHNKESFFLKYLYAILMAVNDVKELRYRIEKDETCQDIIVLYKYVSVITPIAVGNNGEFHSVHIPYEKDYAKFCKKAQKIIDSIPEETDPYAAEKSMDSGRRDIILVAANPRLPFCSMTPTIADTHGSKKPLLNVGKAVMREGKMYIPVFITVHHGLCDGYHVSLFYENLQKYLSEL